MNESLDLDLNDTTLGNTTLSGGPVGPNKELQRVKNILFTIQYVLLPFFFITGLFGNTMTIATMASRHFRHMTSRYILISLAISDTVLLLTQPFNKLFLIDFFRGDLRALSDLSCKIFFVIFKAGKMTSSWLVVLLCFERFIAVVFPLRAKFILRKRFILPAIAMDYIAIVGYNIVWTFSSEVVGGICKPDVPSLKQKIFVTIGSCLYSFIPTVILMILTPTIVVKLFRHQKRRRHLASTRTIQASKNEEETMKASIMVIGIMVAYIILIIPITSVHVYSWTAGVSAFDMNSLGFFVFREIAQILEQINYAINFFLYVMFSTVFRRRVLRIIRCGRLPSGSRSQQLSSSTKSKNKTLESAASVSYGDTFEKNQGLEEKGQGIRIEEKYPRTENEVNDHDTEKEDKYKDFDMQINDCRIEEDDQSTGVDDQRY